MNKFTPGAFLWLMRTELESFIHISSRNMIQGSHVCDAAPLELFTKRKVLTWTSVEFYKGGVGQGEPGITRSIPVPQGSAERNNIIFCLQHALELDPVKAILDWLSLLFPNNDVIYWYYEACQQPTGCNHCSWIWGIRSTASALICMCWHVFVCQVLKRSSRETC